MDFRSFAALLAFSLSLQGGTRSVADLRAAAASGSAEAEYELAERLAVDGVDEHRIEAIVWLQRAAAQGHADAQTHLAWAYHSGVGVQANDAEAVKWERLAAEKGQASAQFYLGSDYEYGLGGLPKDAAKAAQWYRRAAEQNHPIAQAQLGELYAEGRGVPRNDTEAVTWYARAAAQKDFRGQLGLGRMYAAGRGVPKDEKAALQWFERAADQEVDTLDSALSESPGMSDARRRDYFLASGAGRHSEAPGASKERDDLAAKLLAAEPKPVPVLVGKPEEFCPRLEAVMAAGTANFATLQPAETLPGMHPCSVEGASSDDAPPFSYRCTVAEGVDANAARAVREGTQQLLTQCLDASWHADERRHFHDVMVFFSNDKSPLELQLTQREWFSKYDVLLYIDAPLAPLTLTRSHPGGAIDLDTPVDFKSEKAGAGNVVHAFARLLGSDLVIDSRIKGKVTLDRKNTPARGPRRRMRPGGLRLGAQHEPGAARALHRAQETVTHFLVQVSSSSFDHFPSISTSAMCSTFVALILVKTSRTFMVAPPPCTSPSNVILSPSQPGEL